MVSLGGVWLQVRASLDMYRKILDVIEENDYDNFRKVRRQHQQSSCPPCYSLSVALLPSVPWSCVSLSRCGMADDVTTAASLAAVSSPEGVRGQAGEALHAAGLMGQDARGLRRQRREETTKCVTQGDTPTSPRPPQ